MGPRADRPDVLIVGDGILAAATALRLARDGLSVRVIADGAVGGSTRAAGAMLGALGEVTEVPTRPNDRAELELRLQAAARWPSWLDELPGQTPLLGDGTFVFASPHRPSDLVAVDAIETVAAEAGLPFERVDPSEVPGLAPAAGHTAERALYLPTEGWVQAPALLDFLWAIADNDDRIEQRRARVVSLLGTNRRVTGVRTANGEELSAAAVVLCGGAATTDLLQATPELATGIPHVLPAKGVALHLRLPPRYGEASPFRHAVRSPNRDFACGLHVIPRAGGVYLGATNRVTRWPGITGQVTAGEVIRLLGTASREVMVDCARWDIVHTHWGERPLAADGLPVVGATSIDGLYVATGTYRNGVLLAPLIADAIAEAMSGRDVHPLLTATSTRAQPTRSPAEVLRDGLRDYAALVQDPDGPPLRPELARLLETLGLLAFDDADKATELRRQVLELLTAFPLVEMVPEAVIEVCHPELVLD